MMDGPLKKKNADASTGGGTVASRFLHALFARDGIFASEWSFLFSFPDQEGTAPKLLQLSLVQWELNSIQ